MTRITLGQWIEYYRFTRFPFDRPEAGNEEFARPDFLASCFVEPDCFQRILGQADSPVTALLFATRGTGKTTCRVMVDYFCRVGKVPLKANHTAEQINYILSVPHIHLHRLLELSRAKELPGAIPIVRLEHHIIEILSQAISALVELIAQEPMLQGTIELLPVQTRQQLSWLFYQYRFRLVSIQAEFLHSLGLWWPSADAVPIGFQSADKMVKRVQPVIGTYELWQSWQVLSPLDHLTQFAQMVKDLGIPATYVLVDGVDEFTEAAGDPEEAYRVIRPLLTTLRLMDSTPYLAFKFFLPDQVEPFILADPAFRQDRGFIIEQLRWEDEALIEILRRRLDTLKIDTQEDRLVAGFDALCVPELRGQIEGDLVHWVKGNPRHLLLLCGFIVTAHCTDEVGEQSDPYQLNQRDVEVALKEFNARIGGSQKSIKIGQEIPLVELIAQGEHERLEFKASFQWNLHTQSADKSLRMEIVRAIAGMMNRHGGILLIGVKDDGNIIGIENDVKIAKEGSKDKFQLLLEDVIKTYLGLANAAYKQVRFETIEDKLICIVDIQPTPEPVYVQENNVNEFYVRLGNRTNKSDVKEATTYIQSHWGKAK